MEKAAEVLITTIQGLLNPVAIERIIHSFVDVWFQVVVIALGLWATINVLQHILSPARERHWLRR